jgi:hypothetical protein
MIDDFINDIIWSLENINDGTHNTNNEWTIAIKKKLIDVAGKCNLSVNYNLYGEKYKHNEGREWLYDLIIYSAKTQVLSMLVTNFLFGVIKA